MPTSTLEHRLAYRFSRLAESNLRHMAWLYARKHGLSTSVWRIFSIIGRHEPVFAGVAGKLSTMEPDKVTRAVDRLVAMGLVVRKSDAADRRRVALRLSARGRKVYEEIERAFQQVDAKWRSALTAEEQQIFTSLLGKLEAEAKTLFTPAHKPQKATRKRSAA